MYNTLVIAVTVGWLAPGQVNEKEAEMRISNFQRKLAAAKAWKLSFEVEATKTQWGTMSWRGSALIAQGNKINIEVQGKDRDSPFTASYVADGNSFFSTTVARGETTWKKKNVADQLTSILNINAIRYGMFQNLEQNVSPLCVGVREPPKVSLVDCRVLEQPVVDNKKTAMVGFDFALEKKTPGVRRAFTIWFDIATEMPVKRKTEVFWTDASIMTINERYSSWDLEPEIKGSDFTIPK
jgi:hypothetical protein